MDQKFETIGYDVNYDVLDAFKVEAMAAARQTAGALIRLGFKEIPESRGESAYLIDMPGMILAFVVEGLGTLNKIAEELLATTGVSYMEQVQRANFATILNDLSACGAYPLVANELVSVGDERWFTNQAARADMVRGWREACREVECAWGGGETQKLRDIVVPMSAVLAGAAVGVIKPKRRRIQGNIKAGDVIVLVRSSGIHANGVTMARDVAASLQDGYSTRLPNGKTYGEALVGPQHELYGPLTNKALDLGLRLHYVSNITGHGWRKIMRSELSLTYVIDRLPEPHAVFKFIQERSGATDRKMFETFNMGGGVAYILPGPDAIPFIKAAKDMHYRAYVAGHVEKGPRQVILPIEDGTFVSEDYKVR